MDLHVVDFLAGLTPSFRDGQRLFVTARHLEHSPEFLMGLELGNAYLHTTVPQRVVDEIMRRVGRGPDRYVSVHGFECRGNVWRLA
jgi:hypothetical protein